MSDQGSLCKSDILCSVLPEKNISSLETKGIPSDSCVSFCTLCMEWDTKQLLIIQRGDNDELSLRKLGLLGKAQGNDRMAKGSNTGEHINHKVPALLTHTSGACPKVYGSGRSINSNHFLS